MRWPRFSERVNLRGGGVDLLAVPAAVEMADDGSDGVLANQMQVAAGGELTFLVRDSDKMDTFRTSPSGIRAELTRWRKGVKYNVKSVEPVAAGRLLRVVAVRGS